jgi:hypothetical protein
MYYFIIYYLYIIHIYVLYLLGIILCEYVGVYEWLQAQYTVWIILKMIS